MLLRIAILWKPRRFAPGWDASQMAAKKRSGPLRREELDPEPPVKVGALRRPLGFPAANRSPQRDVRTGRLTRAPGRSSVGSKDLRANTRVAGQLRFSF